MAGVNMGVFEGETQFWSASRLMSKPVRLLARRTDSYVHAHTVLRSPMRLFGAVAGASADSYDAGDDNDGIGNGAGVGSDAGAAADSGHAGTVAFAGTSAGTFAGTPSFYEAIDIADVVRARRLRRIRFILVRCVSVLLIVGAFLFDAIRGDSLAQSFPVLLGYATPAVITLLTAAKLGGAVDEVKTQVNGNYDKISSRNRELADQNRELSAKLAALVAYLRVAAPGDAAWAVYFLAGGKPRQMVPTKRLKALAQQAAGLPEWLFDESYEAVGDLAETIALLLPPPAEPADVPLAEWMAQLLPLRALPPDEADAHLRAQWNMLAPEQRLVYFKLITGNFRVGVSRLQVTQALATVSGWTPSASPTG